MLNSNIYQNVELPYEPLPEAAYTAARMSMVRCGFPEKAILDEYSFSSPSKGTTIKINSLVFAHAIHRNPAEYASFTIYNAVNGHSDEALVSVLAASAAPFHILHRDNAFSLWASSVKNNQPVPFHIQSAITYDQLDEVLSTYAADLKPQRIIDVKQGRDTFTLPIFRDNIQPLQLSFWATDVTRKLLVDHFALAVEALRVYARKRRVDIGAYDQELTSLAIQLLGAIILADTGVLGDQVRLHDVSLRQVIGAAYSRFERYFQPELIDRYWEVAEEAYQILRQIRYAGFVPEMLSEIYTAAYSKEQRKKLGRFDTPLYLTRRIWENIPVEYLRPEERYIADMTCGWGSFLIAGHERLANLTDAPSSLREYIRGNDIDPFTAQLAGLGLLLSTSEDSWNIDHEDALNWQWLETRQPNIIIGNPPFGGNRKKPPIDEDVASGTGRTRQEEANKFLNHAIKRLAPDGYLAMIMPGSFIAGEASPELRKQLLQGCDVLEIWELPTGVFPKDVAVQPVVVFTQKKSNKQHFSHNPVRVRTVQPKTLKSFENSGPFTASELVVDQSYWNEKPRKSKSSKNTYIMDYRMILPEYAWRNIFSRSVNLEDFAEVIRGAIVGQKPENKKWTNYPFPKQVPWLTGVKDVMPRSFFIRYEQAATIIYPNDLERPRLDKESMLEDTKVLVVYDPNPTWGKRNKLAIERKDHYVSDNFWVVAPDAFAQQMGITCEVLAAVLNWDVSNAWIVEHLKSPAIPKRAMKTIPFPKDLSEGDCKTLIEAVWQLEEAAASAKEASLEVIQKIDSILKAAYHLDDATFERLRKVMEWDVKPEITLDVQPDQSKANWFISGVVDSVNAEEGTITLWMKSFDELQTVQIAPSMPGWMLRPDAAFHTKIPRKYIKQGSIDKGAIDWGTFYPKPYTYMNEEELLEEFAKLLHEDGKYRIR